MNKPKKRPRRSPFVGRGSDPLPLVLPPETPERRAQLKKSAQAAKEIKEYMIEHGTWRN